MAMGSYHMGILLAGMLSFSGWYGLMAFQGLVSSTGVVTLNNTKGFMAFNSVSCLDF